MAQAIETLPDDPNELKAMLLAERARNERLVQIINEMQRHRFGRRAETLPEDQMLLALEEVEQTEAGAAAATEAKSAAEREQAARKRRTNRGALPAHLPRIETIVDIDEKACPCCKGALHRIGEDVSERLDIAPAQFRVLVTRRPKYACRACEGAIVQAPAPARLIKGGLPTEATIAHVLVSKYADHLPLYRQAQVYMPGKGSTSIVRRSPTGLAAPPGICGPFISVCWNISALRQKSSPTKRRRPRSIPGADAPRPASFEPMRAMTGRSAAPIRRSQFMSMRKTENPSSRSRI